MKLLDEKGLTTVWAAIKNTFTSKSDADGKYAKKADLNPATSTSAGVMTAADKNKLDNIEEDANNYFLPLAANGTRGGIQLGRASISAGDRFQYPLLVDGNEKAYVSIPHATSGLDGLMTSEDKDKLNGIASGANNYILPVASGSTLGGIKVSESADGTSWPICVDSSGLAQAKISGLVSVKGTLFGIKLKSNANEASFGPTQISVKGGGDEESKAIKFPSKSGTFALTSDIPDVSSVCKFYSANDIDLCVYGRINFMTPIGDVNLDSISHKEGIIIFANLTSASNITCSEGFIYNNDHIDNSKRVEPGMFLITISADIAVVSSL